MSYVYIESETAAETGSFPLYTVGHFAPSGLWHPDSDHGGEKGREEAAARVAFLNGGGRDARNGHACGATTKAECECRPEPVDGAH